MMNVNDIWMEFSLNVSKKYCYMQRNENLVYINNGQRYGVRIVSGWMFS